MQIQFQDGVLEGFITRLVGIKTTNSVICGLKDGVLVKCLSLENCTSEVVADWLVNMEVDTVMRYNRIVGNHFGSAALRTKEGVISDLSLPSE